MTVIQLANGYTFHTEITEVVTVDTVGFLRFETRQTKRIGHVCNPQGVYEHGMCMPFMGLSMDEDEAAREVQERLTWLLGYYAESEAVYQKMMKKLGKA